MSFLVRESHEKVRGFWKFNFQRNPVRKEISVQPPEILAIRTTHPSNHTHITQFCGCEIMSGQEQTNAQILYIHWMSKLSLTSTLVQPIIWMRALPVIALFSPHSLFPHIPLIFHIGTPLLISPVLRKAKQASLDKHTKNKLLESLWQCDYTPLSLLHVFAGWKETNLEGPKCV